MIDSEKRMTAEEWRTAEQKSRSAEVDHYYHQAFQRRCGDTYPELDAALRDYIAAVDDPGAMATTLKRFDSGLIRLRDVIRLPF